MDSPILPVPPSAFLAITLWMVSRGITFVVLLLFLCLLPEPPTEHPANEMAMAGLGWGAALGLIFMGGMGLDFVFSLPGLVLLPLFISKILGQPDAARRRRNFYCLVGGLPLLLQALAGLAFLKIDGPNMEGIESICLLLMLHLAAGLVVAKALYKYWLADEYYWSA
ncbi:MAG: hypothetical protein ACRYFZ_06830 [Janthinobacterium lividum]